MPDYYSLLVQKIREAKTDPGKLRELVYEAARLALRRHVNVHYPALSLHEGKRLLGDLEAAIERLETEAGGAVNRPATAPGEDKTGASFVPSRSGRTPAPVFQEFDFRTAFVGKSDASDRPADGKADESPPAQAPGRSDRAASSTRSDEVAQPAFAPRINDQRPFTLDRDDDTGRARTARPSVQIADRRGDETGPLVRPLLAEDGAGLLDWPHAEPHSGPDSRDLVLVPDRDAPANRGATYQIRPDAYPARRDESFRDPAPPRNASNRRILIGIGIASHVAVVILAGAAFYVTMSGRAAPPAAPQDIAATPPQRPAKSPPVVRSAANRGPAAEPLTAASFASAATAALASAATAGPRAFPRPTAYGVYAISNNRLIELEQISASPVDPRARNSLQIVKPSRTVINDAKLAFIAYRRDLTTSAPDKVSVRIAARIARAMTVDPLGKAVMEPPPTASWLIREFGYDLRVSPVPENSEMLMLVPEEADFAFPPGRYELVLGGQSYDFVIAGIIKEPAHCVEGVATARGPAFYECRTQ